MKTLKSTLAIVTLILFAGCASLTDANLDAPETDTTETITTTQPDAPWNSRIGDDMDPIIEEPEMGE